MSDNNNQMTLSLDVEQRLINLGVTYTPGASLSKTIRREAKRRYLASLDDRQLKAAGFRQWPPLVQNEDDQNTLRDATPSEVDRLLDDFHMAGGHKKGIQAISEPMFVEVRGISKEVVEFQLKHGFTFEATRVNAKGHTYFVSKPPTTAEQLRERRSGAIDITAETLSKLPDDRPITKGELFKTLADARVDMVAIKAKADAKAKKEADEFAAKARAEEAAKATAKVLEQAKVKVEQDKAQRLLNK